jgi:hypothetical protein
LDRGQCVVPVIREVRSYRAARPHMRLAPEEDIASPRLAVDDIAAMALFLAAEHQVVRPTWVQHRPV